MTNEYTDSDLDELDEEFQKFDLETIKGNISKYSSNKLCEMIVCDRYFGCYNDLSVVCMEELSKRRINGDNFDFENYINNSLNELPALNLNFKFPDIRETLSQMIGKNE